MVDPKENLVSALKQFMQENQKAIMQEAMKMYDPLELQKEAVEFMEDIIELTKIYIVVPRDPKVDSQVEKKIKTNLLSTYKQYMIELIACSKKSLKIYDDIIKYCHDRFNMSVIDNQLKIVIMRILTYLITGIKDNQEVLSFDWSIENLRKHLDVKIDFISELNTLFIEYPNRDIILNFIKESCESLNHQYQLAIKIFLVKFNVITQVANNDSISTQQCARWIQEIVKEINIEGTVKRQQQKIGNMMRQTSTVSLPNDNLVTATKLPTANCEVEMKDLTNQQKVPFVLLNETEISSYNQEVLKGVMDKIDLTALQGLVVDLVEDADVDKNQAREFMQGFKQGLLYSVTKTQPYANIQSNQTNELSHEENNYESDNEQNDPATSSVSVKNDDVSKSNLSNQGATTKSLLSNSIQHTLLPPPLVPPNHVALYADHIIPNILETLKLRDDYESHSFFSIRQEP